MCGLSSTRSPGAPSWQYGAQSVAPKTKWQPAYSSRHSSEATPYSSARASYTSSPGSASGRMSSR